MYRVLIVDDELHVVDWVYELMQELEQYELDLYKASTVSAAMAMLSRHRMDIVISDIAMPGMTGLELHGEIKKLWPTCKVIFLTGHSDFEFAYEAVRNEAAGYVLKTEDDDVILSTVQKVIASLEAELKQQMELQQAQQQVQTALHAMRSEYLLGLLRGESSTTAQRQQAFAGLGIVLQPELPVFIIAARIGKEEKEANTARNGQVLPALGSYTAQALLERWEYCHYIVSVDTVIWLCQLERNEELQLSAHTYVKETLERIQNDILHNFQVLFSFIYASNSVVWERLALKQEELQQQLQHATVYRHGVLLEEHAVHSEDSEERQVIFERSKLELMKGYLDKGEADPFFHMLSELEQEVADKPLQVQESDTIELFQALSMLMLSCMNRYELQALRDDRSLIHKLTHIEQFANWQELFQVIHNTAVQMFKLLGERHELQESVTVRYVKEYMRNHLHTGISLVELADQVHFNPSYLSRLFKETTGVSITDYLSELRLERAIEMLKENKKVNEIAAAVGIAAPAYFSRFFKKMTKRTPQEYREYLLLAESNEKSRK